MTTSTNPTDDIIELTDIVEEGLPLDKSFEDFATDKAVDATTLDQELDDLLRDAESKPKPVQNTVDEVELDILFDEPKDARPKVQSSAQPSVQSFGPEVDMSDLDDLFDSLHIGDKDAQEDTALDVILHGDSTQSETVASGNFSAAESIDLDLPGMGGEETLADIHDLTEELLADIPETVTQASSEPLQESASGGLLPTPEDLELELTEGTVMDDVELSLNALSALNRMGVELALDDFGTGYSSLAYLKRFPVGKLKIDRSFVRNLEVDPDERAIASTIVSMGRSLRLSVLAEGVETKEQYAILRDIGCELVQGYFFSRPLPPEDLVKFLRKHPFVGKE